MHCQSRSALTLASRSHAVNRNVAASPFVFSQNQLSHNRTDLHCIGVSPLRSLHSKVDVTQIKVLQPLQRFIQDSANYHKNYYKQQHHQDNQQAKSEKTDTATESQPMSPFAAFWNRTIERLSSPERRSGYLWVVTVIALADLLYTLLMGQGSESDIEEALKQHDDQTIVAALLAYTETAHTLDVGMEGEERRKKMLHTLARNSAALEVLFRGLSNPKVGADHFFNCVTILSELMEDEISCDSVCSKIPFDSLFGRNKATLLNSLSDVQRFMLFYLLQQCSHNEIGIKRMAEHDSIFKALMTTFQKYQQNEIIKIQQSGSKNVNVAEIENSDLKVHMASQVAILLTVVNLSTIDSARQQFKSNEGFMRVLHVVASMHRNPSLKGTADSAYLNITKNAQIKAPTVDVDKSVHKYTRANTLTFYTTTLAMGFSYGLFWALRGNMLYGGLKGAALLSKSISNAVTTSAGSFMLGGFIRDCQAVATSPKVREQTEASSATHCAYTAGKIAYLGIGAFVMSAAFPHILAPSIMANMCLSPVIKGVETIQQALKHRNSAKEAPQKKLAQ